MHSRSHSTKNRRRAIWHSAPFYLLTLALAFTAWQIGILLTGDSARRFLFPSPAEVLRRFVKLAGDGSLLHHTSVTLMEMALGLLLGSTLALLLGYAIAHSQFLAYLLEPLLVTSQALPIVAIAPLLTVWFGPGLMSKVVVCALVVFFPILVNVVGGFKSIPPQLRDLFRMMEAPQYLVLIKLEIPAILPTLLSGLKVGGTLAGMGAVVGEFVASSQGLGYLIKQGQNLYDLPMMFVAIITLMAIALCTYGTLALLESQTHRWRDKDAIVREKSPKE